MSQTSSTLRQRVSRLRWILPLSLSVLSIFYQLGPASWIHDHLSHSAHYLVEIVFYAVIGPLATARAIMRIEVWLDEKEQAEKIARASEQRLASITAASADAIIGLNSEGLIESWNNGAELIFGYSSAAILGKPFASLLSGGDTSEVEWHWLYDTTQQAGFVRGYETTCRGADGHKNSVELTATSLEDDQSKTEGISVILRDITDRKRREAEIKELNSNLNELVKVRTQELAEKVDELAQANVSLQKLDQTRSEFVSLVSHQIRAPLTNMRGAVERMQTACGIANSTCSRMFTILDQQVDRLDRLVRDVLSASRIESGELSLQQEPVSVMPLIKEAVEQIFSRTHDRLFSVSDKPGLPLVFADPDRVLEVLTNLLDNAVKYSPQSDEVSVNVRAEQSQVTVSVRDHGQGLPPADLKRVFDKFYRADSSDSQATYGYGLGLYICQKLIEAQNGLIWAENHPDGGVVFSFTLPTWQGAHV